MGNRYDPSMNALDAFKLWYDFSHIAGSAVRRQQNVDGDDLHIDWNRQDQAMKIAGLSFACSLFEELGKKHDEPHNAVLTHLRNAVMHNGANVRGNAYEQSETECLAYLEDESWKEFNPPERAVHRNLFTIDGGMVTLGNGLFFFIERLFDSYMTPEERADPWGIKAGD